MASLAKAKDTIRAMPRGLQLRTTKEVADALERKQQADADTLVADTTVQILGDTPDLNIEDGNQLVAWQEDRERKNQP